jgi:hypothetical protein
MRFAAALLLVAIAFASRASADIQRSGPEIWPGKHELSAHLGYQLGFASAVGDTSGMKLTGEYAYRFHPFVWFDAQLNQTFGLGPRDGLCAKDITKVCYRGGWATQFAAGVKLKFVTKIPLVVEVPILLGITGLYARECDDNAVAVPVARLGGGLKYFLKPRIAVGASVNFDMGPAFHDATVCKTGGRYTDFYGTFDFQIGAEFILGN